MTASRQPAETVAPGVLYDVAVVGAGVVGCAVARLLAHHQLRVALIDAADDIGTGTSKANTAILHTGFDATPGSIEAQLVARGYHLLSDFATQVGISVERTGATLVAWSDEQAERLPYLRDKAVENGYTRCQMMDASDVRVAEPHLGHGVVAGLSVPDEHIIDPWSAPLAFARDALANGCDVLVERQITEVVVNEDTTTLTDDRGRTLQARFVVNAAGLHGDTLHRAAGFDGFTIRPRRGELVVFDKFARRLLNGTVLPVPTAHTKGVLAAPTVFGNVMVGPTADDIDDRKATGSTRGGIDRLVAAAHRILPALAGEEVTAVYAGLRAATEHSDYQLTHDAGARYVGLGGIRSTGLTAAMALAEEAVERLRACGLDIVAKADVRSIRMVPLGEGDVRPYQRGDSRIVCHCERVTEGEIVAALAPPLAATSVDGLRRRTRTLAGRCQGFYCLAEVCAMAGWKADS